MRCALDLLDICSAPSGRHSRCMSLECGYIHRKCYPPPATVAGRNAGWGSYGSFGVAVNEAFGGEGRKSESQAVWPNNNRNCCWQKKEFRQR